MQRELIRSHPGCLTSGLFFDVAAFPTAPFSTSAFAEATADRSLGITLPASLDESDCERIVIKFSFAGLNRRDDDQHGVQHPERYQDRNPDQEDAEDHGDRIVNQHRDLEIQRFLSVRVDLRRVAAFYQPDSKWTENVAQKVKEQSEQCAGVAQDAPRSNIRGSGWSRRRLWIHMQPFAQCLAARQ